MTGDHDARNGFQERGARIRERRETLSMSQADLARMLGTTQQTIDRIEKGAIKNPKLLPDIDRVLFMENENQSADKILSLPLHERRIKNEIDISAGGNLCKFVIFSNSNPDKNLSVSLRGLFLKGFPIENDPDGYAIGIGGSILEQDYAFGDIMLISPMLPIMPGSRVLFWRHGDDGKSARIVRFIEEVADGWVSTHGLSDNQSLMQREDWLAPHAVAAQLFGFDRF